MSAPTHLNLLTGGLPVARSLSAGASAYGELSEADGSDGNGFAALLIDQLLQLESGEDSAPLPLPLPFPPTLLAGQDDLPELTDLVDPSELLDAERQDPAAFFAALGVIPATPLVDAPPNPAVAATVGAPVGSETPLLREAFAALVERLTGRSTRESPGSESKPAATPGTLQERASAQRGGEMAAAAKMDSRAELENRIAGVGGNFTGNSDKAAAKLAAAPESLSLPEVLKAVAEPQVKTVSPPLHGLVAAASTMTPQSAPSSGEALRISTPVSGQNWASEFGQKILWLAGSERQSAQLSLNPAHLGPVDISINIDGDRRATMLFASPHAEVREAIENALPRLRELFASANIELGQTNVSAESFRQQQQQNAQFQQPGGNSPGSLYPQGANGRGESDSVISESSVIRHGNGLINTFA